MPYPHRFEEAGINPFALMRDEVEHLVDEFGRSEHLTEVDYAMTVVRHGSSNEHALVLSARAKRTCLRAMNLSHELFSIAEVMANMLHCLWSAFPTFG